MFWVKIIIICISYISFKYIIDIFWIIALIINKINNVALITFYRLITRLTNILNSESIWQVTKK